ncbi:MAG: hypothetical protein AAGA66_17725 [Bacteroidota bacterium]
MNRFRKLVLGISILTVPLLFSCEEDMDCDDDFNCDDEEETRCTVCRVTYWDEDDRLQVAWERDNCWIFTLGMRKKCKEKAENYADGRCSCETYTKVL